MGYPDQLEESINKALKIAYDYGGVGGVPQKTWVIDQMVRVLAGEYYDKIIEEACVGGNSWDCGTAPIED